MTVPGAISVATSLVPDRDHAIQSAAVASWLALGFSVVSLNSAQEATRVKQQFPSVAVVTASRTAEKISGKRLPFIGDLLSAAHDNAPSCTVIGVINADIILRPLPNAAAVICDSAANAVVMLPRIDIPDLSSIATFQPTGREVYSVGYDGVFMSPHWRTTVPDNLFCIGMPFWDYWLPFMTLLQGHPLKSIASPLALHVMHPTRWDGSIYVFFHALISDLLREGHKQAEIAETPALGMVIDILRHTYSDLFDRATKNDATQVASADALAHFYDRVQEVVVHHIKSRAALLTLREMLNPAP